MAIIYLSGPPGVGKTTTARLLTELIQTQIGIRTMCFSDNALRRKLTALDLIVICAREPMLVIRLVQLFQEAKRCSSLADALRSFNRAVLAVRYLLALRSAESIAFNHVLLIDEPIWHMLWSQLFPVNRVPDRKRLTDTLSRMLPYRSDNPILVDLSLPHYLCRNRVAKRLSGGRFSSSSDERLLSLFQVDALYGQIRKAVVDAWPGHIADFSNDAAASPSEVARDVFNSIREPLARK